MGISRYVKSSAATAVFAIVAVPLASRAQTYNPATAFEHGYTTKSNPNGVWSYGYSAGFTSPITLYNETTQNGVNGPNAQYWLSPAVDVGTSPAAEYNDGPAYNDGNVDFLADEFLLVAGIGGQYSNLIFTAPTTATYSISSQFRGAQYKIGTVVAVVINRKGVFSEVFTSKVTAVGQLVPSVPFNTKVNLAAGDKVIFSVGPGESGLQNTGLSATITNESVCDLVDSPTLNATTGVLTMNFTLATPVKATWNGWLADQGTLVSLWSQSEPATEPPVRVTKTKSLAKSGVVGILSTLSTPTGGITCSSWVLVNSGTP